MRFTEASSMTTGLMSRKKESRRPSAARGILEAIHWKPAIQWMIDRLHVLKPIRFENLRRNELGHKVSPANVQKAAKSGDAWSLHAVIEDELHQNGHDQPTGRGQQRHRRGDPEAPAQLVAYGQAPAQHPQRPHRLLAAPARVRLGLPAPARVRLGLSTPARVRLRLSTPARVRLGLPAVARVRLGVGLVGSGSLRGSGRGWCRIGHGTAASSYADTNAR